MLAMGEYIVAPTLRSAGAELKLGATFKLGQQDISGLLEFASLRLGVKLLFFHCFGWASIISGGVRGICRYDGASS